MMKKIAASLAVLCSMQGCASINVDQITPNGGLVTAARNGAAFEEIQQTQIHQRDTLVVVTRLKWDPQAGSAGTHAVNWTWYEGDKVVAVRDKNMRLEASPYRMYWRMPASGFDPGHYRVVVSIDKKVIDTQEYDIIQ